MESANRIGCQATGQVEKTVFFEWLASLLHLRNGRCVQFDFSHSDESICDKSGGLYFSGLFYTRTVGAYHYLSESAWSHDRISLKAAKNNWASIIDVLGFQGHDFLVPRYLKHSGVCVSGAGIRNLRTKAEGPATRKFDFDASVHYA